MVPYGMIFKAFSVFRSTGSLLSAKTFRASGTVPVSIFPLPPAGINYILCQVIKAEYDFEASYSLAAFID
jgi:hypothetical protein